MIINMSYVEIEKYKVKKYKKYSKYLKEYSECKILSHNELHGFFKFILNFYRTDFWYEGIILMKLILLIVSRYLLKS